uniref:Uncharacterized protein n=1 Tax=Chenopodium quinoa TaxID=63459 RepID=A0A803M690_CHEQI
MASMKLVFFFVLARCSSFPLRLHALSISRKIPKVEAIYQFGDSISDIGNLIRESPVGEHTTFARLPYGQTFFHKPTGRCSNGLLMIDYFAKYFKLPFLDAYLNEAGNFSHGVNFAVAGSTALDTSTLAAKKIRSPFTNSSLSVQMLWFRSHLLSHCPNSKEKQIEEVQQMVDEVIQAITTAVKELISFGASKVVVPGNFAIGCMPIYLSTFKTSDSNMYDELQCIKGLNGFATFQNDRLQVAIKELQTQYPNVAIVYADYFNALKGLLQNAASNGFERDEVQKSCCGIGNNDYNFNITRMCGNDGVPVCRDPYKRISWDGVHMTQHAYRVMAKELFKQIVRDISYQAYFFPTPIIGLKIPIIQSDSDKGTEGLTKEVSFATNSAVSSSNVSIGREEEAQSYMEENGSSASSNLTGAISNNIQFNFTSKRNTRKSRCSNRRGSSRQLKDKNTIFSNDMMLLASHLLSWFTVSFDCKSQISKKKKYVNPPITNPPSNLRKKLASNVRNCISISMSSSLNIIQLKDKADVACFLGTKQILIGRNSVKE